MKSLILARVWVLRGGRAAFALLLLLRRTPGMGRVAETELYLCLVSPLVRRRGNWRRYWGSLESTSGWSCVCNSFALHVLRFAEQTCRHHRPRFKIRVFRVFERASC